MGGSNRDSAMLQDGGMNPNPVANMGRDEKPKRKVQKTGYCKKVRFTGSNVPPNVRRSGLEGLSVFTSSMRVGDLGQQNRDQQRRPSTRKETGIEGGDKEKHKGPPARSFRASAGAS